jgi:hypothetical protein
MDEGEQLSVTAGAACPIVRVVKALAGLKLLSPL